MKTPKMTAKTIAKHFISALFAFAIVVGFSVAAHADDPPAKEPKIEFPFKDEALLGFFDANRELSVLQRETQEDINNVIVEHGLTPERFTQIGNAARIGALDGGAFLPEEIEAFNTVAPKVTEIQRNMQAMMQGVMAEKGLTTQLYQEILTEFRTNQDLQDYVRELARDRAIEAAREERRRQREDEANAEEEGNQQ
jgi:ADP-ribosylglycohydrolase